MLSHVHFQMNTFKRGVLKTLKRGARMCYLSAIKMQDVEKRGHIVSEFRTRGQTDNANVMELADN